MASASSAGSISGFRVTQGHGSGRVLKLDDPVSFWGGVGLDGAIIDVHHPQHTQSVTGRVLVMTSGRGSSSGTYSFAELIRADLAPAAIVMLEPDAIVALGAIVAGEMYAKYVPVLMVSQADYDQIKDGQQAVVDAPVTSEAGTLQLS
ncbi:MAG: DUF126 domain-containing protein [Actinomycetes bacterium]